MKNVEWLKNKVTFAKTETSEYMPHDEMVNKEYVLTLINQLDEPEVLSQELPVIPQFVAKFIERYKARTDLEMWHVVDWLASDDYEENEELTVWYRENSTTFARAWLDGFTVEEEQKYYAKLLPVNPPKGTWNSNLSGGYYWTVETGDGLGLGEYIIYPVGMTQDAVSKTKDEWANLGINDDNADFVKVGELEE